MEPKLNMEPQLSFQRDESRLRTALEKLRADHSFSQKVNEELLTQLTEVEISLEQTQAKLASIEYELSVLHRENSNLSTELEQSRQNFNDLNLRWETTLQETKQNVEAELEEKFRETRNQLSERCQQAEARTRDLETKFNKSEPQVNTQGLEQSKAPHAKEIEDARRMANFYKSNAEKVSKQNQEIIAENRMLQQTINVKNQQVEEQSSLIEALRGRK